MTDIIISNSKGVEIFVRDENDDGSFDEGERIGVSGAGDRFEVARVSEALSRVGLTGLHPGARLHRIGAYIDFLREAERCTNAGELMMAAGQLREAEEFADNNGIVIDRARLAEMRWRVIDGARDAGAAGLDTTSLKAAEVLRCDDDAAASGFSAGLILDLLSTRASIANVENSAGPGRDRLLAELRTRETELSGDIARRSERIRRVLTSGSRTTVADQTSANGTVLRVGDHVRYCDPESGMSWSTPFVITGFEIRADRVIVRGVDMPSAGEGGGERSGDLDYLEVLPPEERAAPRDVPPLPEGRHHPMDRLLTRLGQGWENLRSFFFS